MGGWVILPLYETHRRCQVRRADKSIVVRARTTAFGDPEG